MVLLWVMLGCGDTAGADWSGVYAMEGYASSQGCVTEVAEEEAPARSLALSVSAEQLDIMLCQGSVCDHPWWTGWVESVGPRRVNAWVGQALGSPSLDGVPRCSVAWSEVALHRTGVNSPVQVTGEVWQVDGVALDSYGDCAEVLDARASESDAPCVGAWTFEATRAP
jgi:hypothetical protein